jgi:hypothetical protein
MLEIRENQLYPFHPCSHPAKRGKAPILQVIFSVALSEKNNNLFKQLAERK